MPLHSQLLPPGAGHTFPSLCSYAQGVREGAMLGLIVGVGHQKRRPHQASFPTCDELGRTSFEMNGIRRAWIYFC